MKIVLLVAHADDETIGAGGLLAQLIRRRYDVSIILASDGQLTAGGRQADNIPAFKKACKLYGIDHVAYLGLKDQYFETYSVADIASMVRNVAEQPDIIISHSSHDLNKDHRIMSEVAKIAGRPLHKPTSILAMENIGSSAWSGVQFLPNLYVDISDTFQVKQQALALYENELRSFPHPHSLHGVEIAAKYRGMEAGYHYAEAFRIVRLHGQHMAFGQGLKQL